MTDENSEITAIVTTTESEALPYAPPPQKRKRKKKKEKPPVGVAGLLDYARIKFSTEQGDYDVEEDNSGRYKIGGEELSFEHWGQLTRTNEDGVYKAPIVVPKQKMKKPELIYEVESTSNGRQSKKKKPQKEKKQPDEKDEGELSDSEDNSSSSSDSDSGTESKRIKKRKSTVSDNKAAMDIFAKGYQYRNLIVQSLNLHQKMAFAELLRQQLASN